MLIIQLFSKPWHNTEVVALFLACNGRTSLRVRSDSYSLVSFSACVRYDNILTFSSCIFADDLMYQKNSDVVILECGWSDDISVHDTILIL